MQLRVKAHHDVPSVSWAMISSSRSTYIPMHKSLANASTHVMSKAIARLHTAHGFTSQSHK